MLQKHQSRPLWARELKLGVYGKDLYNKGRAPCGRVN